MIKSITCSSVYSGIRRNVISCQLSFQAVVCSHSGPSEEECGHRSGRQWVHVYAGPRHQQLSSHAQQKHDGQGGGHDSARDPQHH